MSEAKVIMARPDVDIEEAIDDLIAHYPPLAHDRRRIQCRVKNGVVTLSGHVMARITHRYLEEQLPAIDGVKSVKSDKLYDDETIRLEVGKLIAPGVQVRVEYGAVILAGRLPGDVDAGKLVRQVKKIPGVDQVLTNFV